jgi:hypothetical protein
MVASSKFDLTHGVMFTSGATVQSDINLDQVMPQNKSAPLSLATAAYKKIRLRNKFKCFHCGIKGHIEDKCFKLHDTPD